MATSSLKNLNKEEKDEFSFILLVCGVFTVALVVIDFFVAKWGAMPVWVLVLAIVFHALTAWAWIKVIGNWTDPKYDYWRKIVIATAIAGMLVILFHRAGWIENKMFQQDVGRRKMRRNDLARQAIPCRLFPGYDRSPMLLAGSTL